MISGNKGFKKQAVSKSHKPKHSGVTFRNDRNKKVKKKGSPLSGVKILPETKIVALLQGEEPKPKQQENEMADMKSELTKVINAWEAKPEIDNTIPEVPQMTATDTASMPVALARPTATISQQIFDLIRDNPGHQRSVYLAMLNGKGAGNTPTALISQFIRQKLVHRDDNGSLTVTRRTYTPMFHKQRQLPNGLTQPRKPRIDKGVSKPRATQAQAHGIAAIVHQPLITRAPEAREQWMPSAPPVAEEWTVESVVDKLNIRQARAVYIELRTLLGVE